MPTDARSARVMPSSTATSLILATFNRLAVVPGGAADELVEEATPLREGDSAISRSRGITMKNQNLITNTERAVSRASQSETSCLMA